jgi:RNA polymerase sigma factor (sigma-70 family)
MLRLLPCPVSARSPLPRHAAVRAMHCTLGPCDMVSICGESMKEYTDEQLVQECLRGNQDAWTALIRRYRNLIYGVIRSYRPPDSDAADIFQSVCVELFHDLPRLREVTALRRWLISVANRQCLRWKSLQRRTIVEAELVDPDSVPDELNSERLAEIERAQILRQAMDTLPNRCREMIRLLFLQPVPIPYDELANHLGLAVGSIGFIRRRCLDKLKSVLDKAGF